MREQLIRYLLGELDADERRDLQSRLKSSPELRAELEQLRSCFAANQDEDLFAPDAPSGLAARTAGLVAGGEGASNSLGARQTTELSHAGGSPAGFLGWSLADLTVAGGVMLAVSMLIFPAIQNSRDGTRRVVCQDNLRQIEILIATHAQNRNGLIPEVGAHEPAGVFAIRLIGRGYISSDDLAKLLVCPGAPVADKIRAGVYRIVLPSAEEIHGMSPVQLAHAAANASPCYNYRLPYQKDGRFISIQEGRGSISPVLSDAAGDGETDSMSPNHGGRLVQVQCADGSLRLLTSVTLPGVNDDMYHNDLGKVAAGMGPWDTVLAPSNATPAGDGAEGK
jgi:hypothetical protein